MDDLREPGSVDYRDIPRDWIDSASLGDFHAAVITAPEGHSIYIGDVVLRAEELAERANPNIDTVVNYYDLFDHMTKPFQDPDDFFADRVNLPHKGVYILEDHVDEARTTADSINQLAQLIAEETFGFRDDSEAFSEYIQSCSAGEDYFGYLQTAYDLSAKHVPRLESPKMLALLRAGGLARRLSEGVDPQSPEWNAVGPNDVDVVMKRAHPTHEFGEPVDMWALVKWLDRSQLTSLHGRNVEVPDLILATGASLGGVVLSALMSDVQPKQYDFRFSMGTMAGVAFWQPIFEELGIPARFSMLRMASEMNKAYYLQAPAFVEDAGDITEAFLPAGLSERSRQ